jgi:hypothetical protein
VSAADTLSGVDQATLAPNPLVLTAEGDGVTGTVSVSDRAGNVTTETSPAAKIDKTPPLLLPAIATPSPNAAGWSNSDVTLTWSCVDALSGIASSSPGGGEGSAGPGSVRQIHDTLTSEGALQVRSATCTDQAGNLAAQQSEPIGIDKTPPTLGFGAQDPPANPGGWNRSDVRWPFSPHDSLSGLDPATPTSAFVGGEGVGLTTRVTLVDVAGNSAFFDTPAVSIDRSQPQIALLTRLPAANAEGWNNSDVSATWSCSDGLSGVLSETVSATLVDEGAGQSVSATCLDAAGNSASDTLAGVNIDKTAPVVSCSNSAPSLWPPNHKLATVRTLVTPGDALSGSAGFSLVSVSSNEPDNGLGDGDTVGDIQGFDVGTPDTEGQLRAERAGGGSGRVYAIVYEGRDAAGNRTTCTTAVRVAHNQGR